MKSFIKKYIPVFLLDGYHYALAIIGAVVFRFPSRKLKVIGVTGTSGKSTTVDFITRILEENGERVVSNSSIRFKIGNKEWVNDLKMGMPGRFFMQKLLRQAVNAGCKYAVLEVTSEGIKQFRHKFINFDTAVFTNLSPEHIESHGGFENYRNEKLKLFKTTSNFHIINIDDENAKYFLDIPAKKVITFGIEKGDVNLKNTNVALGVLGDFNRYNSLAAIAATAVYGVSLGSQVRALEKVKEVPGRMEVVQKDPFLVIVDYAHTPVQLEQAYKSLPERNLVCVLGACGGGRDAWKRPELGRVAKKYCREIIVTNEDPYDEDPVKIINQVAQGAQGRAQTIIDRREAIHRAIQLAKPGDAVVITGKGSEVLMCVEKGKKIPWDDREIAREALKKHYPSNS